MSGRYTVEHTTRDVVIVYQPIPIDDLVALMKAWEKRGGKDWVAHSGLAQALNVVIAVGPLDACNAWYAELNPVAATMEKQP